jgi:hypothetical protein
VLPDALALVGGGGGWLRASKFKLTKAATINIINSFFMFRGVLFGYKFSYKYLGA